MMIFGDIMNLANQPPSHVGGVDTSLAAQYEQALKVTRSLPCALRESR